MKTTSFTGCAKAFGKDREIDFCDGSLRIHGLTMAEAERIIRALEGNVLTALSAPCDEINHTVSDEDLSEYGY